MQVRRLSPRFAAEVRGLQLSRLDYQHAEALWRLLDQFGVLVLRQQRLTPAGQVAAARVLGPLFDERQFDPIVPWVVDQPGLVQFVNHDRRPPRVNHWHADYSFLAQPPAALMLRAVELPSLGGDTIWCDIAALAKGLEPGVAGSLTDRKAVHSHLPAFAGSFARHPDPNIGAAFALRHSDTTHPVLMEHPRTDAPLLFVNETFTVAIEGESGSRMLEGLLSQIRGAHDHMFRHRWQPGDVVIWDNLRTQHYGVADYFPSRRIVHRVAIARPGGPGEEA